MIQLGVTIKKNGFSKTKFIGDHPPIKITEFSGQDSSI